jgi:hypothetical protein
VELGLFLFTLAFKMNRVFGFQRGRYLTRSEEIGRPSEVIYPPRERRRSSVWSGTSGSPDEKKGMFGGWFGFGSGSGSGSRSEVEKK